MQDKHTDKNIRMTLALILILALVNYLIYLHGNSNDDSDLVPVARMGKDAGY